MKLDNRTKERIAGIAKSETGTFLVEYFEQVKNQIADIRYGEGISEEARIAAIGAIDELLVDKFRVLSQEKTESLGNDSMR